MAEIERPGGVGIAEHELISHLGEVLGVGIELPVCVVTESGMPLLEKVVRSACADRTTVVTANRIRDVASWLDEQQGPVAIVVYLSLWKRGTTDRALAELRANAAPDSRLYFAEPTLGLGLAALAQKWGRALIKKRLRLSFHRDIPEFVRSADWTPTSVKRVSLGLPASLMTFVVGEARAYGE